MSDMENIVKVAVDAYKGNVEKYSVKQSQEVIYQALVEANGGNTYLDYKAIRDGKCQGLFSLIEEILGQTVIVGVQENELFNVLVDLRNVAEGDKPVFKVADNSLYIVSDAADGTQAVRRQRLGGATETTIPTTLKVVRIYEELNRVLSKRIDFNEFIAKVAESFRQKLLEDTYALWSTVTAAQLGGATFFPVAGVYNEDALLDLVSHVEAAAGGKQATIIGTKKAIRKLNQSVVADAAKNDLRDMGYYGKFYGTPVVAIPQSHKAGTSQFAMEDDVVTVVAGDEKPIKLVYEGDPIILMGDPMNNADLTQEYLYGEKYGMGIVVANGNSGIGRYKMT